jgi:ATP-binding cassette, subfamily B, multidrug efflux pump
MASVDMHTAAEILAELKSARRDRTTIIVSQRMASVRDADNIVVLDAGRIIERGTHAELLQQNGLYAAMYRRELREAEDEDEVNGE